MGYKPKEMFSVLPVEIVKPKISQLQIKEKIKEHMYVHVTKLLIEEMDLYFSVNLKPQVNIHQENGF